MLYHQDGLRPGLPFSQINFKVRHLVFQSIFLPVESGVVRHSNTQIHLDKVNEFKIDTKSTVTLLSLFDEMSHQEQ